MTTLYSPDFNKEIKKKKTIYLSVSVFLFLFCLLGVLLIYFLHPRNMMWLYYGIALLLFFFWVISFYYFFFYKYMYLNAKQSFLKRFSDGVENEEFLFKERGKDIYSNKLSFSSYVFLDREGKEKTFLVLNEGENLPFLENKKYVLLFSRDALYGYEEAGNEK